MEGIRRATEEDISGVGELFDAYRQFYGKESDLTAAVEFIRCRIQTDDSVIFVAESDPGSPESTLTGFVQLYPTYSSISMKRAWILNDLYVVREARSGGIGRQLVERCHELARETNAAYVALETAPNNAPAKRLYESLGYSIDKTFDHYAWSPQEG